METVTSNPGHVLMSRIMKQERAMALVNKLLSKAMFTGYGIRTMAEVEKAYNPIVVIRTTFEALIRHAGGCG